MITVNDVIYCPGLKNSKFFAYRHVVKDIQERADANWFETDIGWISERGVFETEQAARRWWEGG